MCKTLLLAIAAVAPLIASPIAGGLCVPSGTNAYYGTLAEFVALGHDGCSLSQRVRIYDIGVILPPLASPDLSVYRTGAFNGHTPSDEPTIFGPEFMVFGAPFTALPEGTTFTLSWTALYPTTVHGGVFDWQVGLPPASPESTFGTVTATAVRDLPICVFVDLTDAPEPTTWLPLCVIFSILGYKRLMREA